MMAKTDKKNDSVKAVIPIVIICTFITAAAQLCLKLGMARFAWSISALFSDWQLILGCALYLIGAVVMVLALKKGELSLVYPLISLAFIWVALISSIILREKIAFMQWIGILVIIIGVSFVSLGASLNAKRGAKSA
jgi:drug/metabolite transporter (DMT)-like permease